jgi:hypothetical protein
VVGVGVQIIMPLLSFTHGKARSRLSSGYCRHTTFCLPSLDAHLPASYAHL